MTATKAEYYELDDDEEMEVVICTCESVSFYVHESGLLQCCHCEKIYTKWALVRVH